MKTNFQALAISFLLLFNSSVMIAKEKEPVRNLSTQSVAGFEENKGQVLGLDGTAQPGVKFIYNDGRTQIFLMQSGIAYQFTKMHYPESFPELMRNLATKKNIEQVEAHLDDKVRIETYRMDMNLSGANQHAEIIAEQASSDYINYYNLNATEVRRFAKVTYREIYPGIDWIIYNRNGEIKYDFKVKPGADPLRIKMLYSYQERLNVNEDGSFSLQSKLGNITEKKPLSFQNDKTISTSFVTKGDTVGFALDRYNKMQELVIDPAVVWATYYGGTKDDFGGTCTTDQNGNVYLVGSTTSTQAIAAGGYQNTYSGVNNLCDAFVVKFNAAGVRQWATYYGSIHFDYGYACSIDTSGNVLLFGTTSSSINISSNGFQNTYGGGTADGFVVKFTPSGTRLWASYYGGPATDNIISGETDKSGFIYLCGFTSSTVNIANGGFQTTNAGGNDAFLIKADGAGMVLWSTYMGGANSDMGTHCSIDNAGNIYLVGYTQSTTGIAQGGFQNVKNGQIDGFVTKFSPTGGRLWSTYYGGFDIDFGNYCHVDRNGDLFFLGVSRSGANIASGGFQNFLNGVDDLFLVKFNSNGNRLWATYIGGEVSEDGGTCVTDSAGNIFIGACSSSTSGVAVNGTQMTSGGLWDGFLAKLNPAGIPIWCTYHGGSGQDYAYSCALGPSGAIYLSGQAQSTAGIASGGHQNTNGGNNAFDVYMVKFCENPDKPFGILGNQQVCLGDEQSFTVAPLPGPVVYNWTIPSNWTGVPSGTTILLTPLATGVVSVTASNGCGTSPVQTMEITVESCLGLTQHDADFLISVFPNPAEANFSIHYENNKMHEISLYSITGEKIISRSSTEKTDLIDVKSFSKGVYIVEIIEGENIVRKKIIKN